MSEARSYTITMNDGTTQDMTSREVADAFGLTTRAAHSRLTRSGWRTEALLRQTPAQALKRNTDRFRKVLSGERTQRQTHPRNGHY